MLELQLKSNVSREYNKIRRKLDTNKRMLIIFSFITALLDKSTFVKIYLLYKMRHPTHTMIERVVLTRVTADYSLTEGVNTKTMEVTIVTPLRQKSPKNIFFANLRNKKGSVRSDST